MYIHTECKPHTDERCKQTTEKNCLEKRNYRYAFVVHDIILQ